MKTAGQFYYEDGKLYGPRDYMRERGNDYLDEIMEGRSTVANYGMIYSPDPVTAILVALQTDYAAWVGMRDFNAMRERAAERENRRSK